MRQTDFKSFESSLLSSELMNAEPDMIQVAQYGEQDDSSNFEKSIIEETGFDGEGS